MLRSVYINNIALIKSQTLDFCDGFNVLSGETGAGKSIIVDSLLNNKHVLGCVAGDDTVFVACRDEAGAKEVCKMLTEIAAD